MNICPMGSQYEVYWFIYHAGNPEEGPQSVHNTCHHALRLYFAEFIQFGILVKHTCAHTQSDTATTHWLCSIAHTVENTCRWEQSSQHTVVQGVRH